MAALALVGGTALRAQVVSVPAAHLHHAEGTVAHAPAGETEWQDVQPRQVLERGDRLWTDGGTRAELQAGGHALRLDERTQLVLENATPVATQLSLTQGSVLATVTRVHPGDSFEIGTPNLALRARAPGDYRIDVDAKAGTTRVTVLSGLAVVYGERGEAMELRNGQRATFRERGLARVRQSAFAALDAFDRWAGARRRGEPTVRMPALAQAPTSAPAPAQARSDDTIIIAGPASALPGARPAKAQTVQASRPAAVPASAPTPAAAALPAAAPLRVTVPAGTGAVTPAPVAPALAQRPKEMPSEEQARSEQVRQAREDAQRRQARAEELQRQAAEDERRSMVEDERRRIAEAARQAELDKRQAQARRAEQQRKAAQARREQEQQRLQARRADQERRQAQVRRAAEEKRQLAARRAEEEKRQLAARKAEEEKRQQAARRAEEDGRVAAQQRQEEERLAEARRQQLQRLQEQAAREEQATRQQAQALRVHQVRRALEERREEEARREEVERQAEEQARREAAERRQRAIADQWRREHEVWLRQQPAQPVRPAPMGVPIRKVS